LLGLVLVEWVLRRWHRIPSPVPTFQESGPLAHGMLLTLAAFVVFINIGGGLIHVSLDRPFRYVIPVRGAAGRVRRPATGTPGALRRRAAGIRGHASGRCNVIPWS
jgi:hypothetical protein